MVRERPRVRISPAAPFSFTDLPKFYTCEGMTLNISALHHVQITVSPEHEAAAVDFYGRVLGLARIEKPKPLASRGGAWFDVGGAQLHISLEEGAEGHGSKRHVCLLVDDLTRARQSLLDAGLDVEPEETEPYGLRRFFVRDPAGNKLEIGQLPD